MTQFVTSLLWVNYELFWPSNQSLTYPHIGYCGGQTRSSYCSLHFALGQRNHMRHFRDLHHPSPSDRCPTVARHIRRCSRRSSWLCGVHHGRQQRGSGLRHIGVSIMNFRGNLLVTRMPSFCWGFGGVAGAIIGGACRSLSCLSAFPP
jgi:hypothetical protein